MGDIVRLRARANRRKPSRTALLSRAVEARLLALLRLALWRLLPRAFPRPAPAPAEAFPVLLYQRVHPIGRPEARRWLPDAAGPHLELALAAAPLDGLLVTEDRPLSFWRALGRIRAAAHVHGPSHAGGCMLSAEEGARLLSGALLAMATTLGWRVLERHEPHPALGGPGVLASCAGNAAVAWPYRDLRLAPREGRVRLEVEVRAGALHLRVRGEAASRNRPVREATGARRQRLGGGGHRSDGVLLRLEPRDAGR